MAAKHPRDLANVAIDLAQRAVTDTDAKVDSVLRSGAAGNHNDNLQYCRLDLATVASTIPVCRTMIVNNKPASDQQQLVPNDYFECAGGGGGQGDCSGSYSWLPC
nr:unnamed protein product [Digitaria exilis]